MPSLSTKAFRTWSRLVLAVSIWVIFTSGNGCAFSLLSWFPSEGSFALGQWQGGVIGGYEWEDQQTSNAGTSTSFVRNRLDEDVHLRNNGFYLIDPRLLEGSAGGDLDFFQEADKYTGANGNTDGTLIGWDVNVSVLGEMPYTAIFFTNRNETDISTEFGGRTKSLNENFGGIAMLRQDSILSDELPYFSADVYANQGEADQSTSQLGQTFKTDETRDAAGLDAYKGFQTADLDFSYQFLDDKYTGTARYSFITNWLTLGYSLDFGPTLNRRFDSNISYLSRSGFGGNESFLYADERLRIDHFKNLSTTYEYLLTENDVQGEQDVSNTATFQVQYRPFRNLTETVSLQGFYETVPQGHTDFYASELASGYNHSIPWGGNLFLDGDGRYQIDQSHVSGPVRVVDEKHTAPAFFGPGIGFNLNNPFVVTSTIVMFDTRGGARIPTTLGVDYTTLQQGQLTQIVILPTTIRILPGDPLEVSYSYVAGPSGRYSTTTLSAGAGVTFSWIGLSFAHVQSNQSMQSGIGGQYLYDTRQETGQLDIHKDTEWFAFKTSALYQIYHSQSESFLLDYTLQNYGEYLTFWPAQNTTVNLDGNEMFTDYSHPSRHDADLDFESSLVRLFSGGNFATVFARAREVTVTQFPTETDYEAGLRANFRYGKIFIEPWFSWIDRIYGPTKTNDLHLMLKIGRDL